MKKKSVVKIDPEILGGTPVGFLEESANAAFSNAPLPA
jgi:hypothetical protein